MHNLSAIQQKLLSMQDVTYKEFQCKLMPTVDPSTVIGVRMPALRQLAKTFKDKAKQFQNSLPHRYYEENNLHGILVSNIKDINNVIIALDRFLPYVDNWATCDLIAPKVFQDHTEMLMPKVLEWIGSSHIYTVRFGIGVLLRYFLDDAFVPEQLSIVAGIRSQEYYVNMMIAWYFATALAKQYNAALPYLLERRLDTWTHNKAIQKAIESYRITPDQKSYLRTLKYKSN